MINASGWPSLSIHEALLEDAVMLVPADPFVSKFVDFL